MIRPAPLLLAGALVLGSALAADAQPGANSRTLADDAWCSRDLGGNSERRARACEVRETLISATALDLDGSPNGSVTVERWDRPDVLVRARVLAYARDASAAQRSVRGTRIETGGGTVRARLPRSDQASNTTVSFEIFAPRRTGLSVQTQNGAVRIRGLEGGVRVRAVNGSVALAEVGGDVQVRTVNGAVSVAVGDAWAGRGLQIATTNGSVSLTLPPNVSADLDAQTRVGRIALAGLDVAALDRQRGGWTGDRVQARLGRGGPPVRVATTNGAISIRQTR